MGGIGDRTQADRQPFAESSSTSQPVSLNSAPNNTSVEATDSPPADIYKCFDHENLPTYVNAADRANFHHCQFFSRSFAGVTEQLRQQAQNSVAPARPIQETIGPRLTCSGAGSVSFRGQEREFECADYSYNYSPGSTGGDIQFGTQYAAVAAYDQDYLATAGSCGGTITSENGRVLHLEPTKDCPPALIVEARRIAQAVHDDLNIKVSGAFLARQQGFSAQINQIAADVGVDPFLVHAVISAESAYKQRAISHAGAQGLMQLMPATAARFNVTDPFHSGQNIRGGTTYLKWLLKEFNGNLELAIAGYNAGEGNVRKYGYKIPPFIETKAYVPKVLQYYGKYRANPAQVGL
ncbi:lytic transglycosylase domain-containing protein [Suttonella sp. R2A3]|uniref:lytic transglycosylase domain-containing protein n=1 Tax=Suttonella sp. R2A3 TaxID=2908648 RepID=UPI001F259CA1|nr:lytic transglycosylase domain-containing protein [Suttonella sp. R2A3]UJF24708.1 lytic transglycosylase domain-containing protein [Suttonella sp. R2A3]